MQIVASQDLGKLGPSVSSPVTISWHWAYHLPGYLIWLVVAALLQRRKTAPHKHGFTPSFCSRRRRPADVARLLSLEGDSTDTTGGFVLTVAVAWTCVWLVSPSLSRFRAGTAFCVALGLMLLVGVLAYFGQFEIAVDETMAIWTGFVAAASGTLLIAVLLSRYCRGAQYRSKPFDVAAAVVGGRIGPRHSAHRNCSPGGDYDR